MATSNFTDLYKNKGRTEDYQQTERRRELLRQQKDHRHYEVDNARGIVEFLENLPAERNYTINKFFRNKLQYSEWMYERPEDLNRWYMVPCPLGTRVLLVIKKGLATAYDANGKSITRLKLKFWSHRVTVLDCFTKDNVFYVIDVLVFNDIDVVNCECQFRFSWLKAKFLEDEYETKFACRKDVKIRLVPYYDLEDPVSVGHSFEKWPFFEKNIPKLDGLLFYHKDSHYVHGKTPLVTWLFPFMLPEVLDIHTIDGQYMAKKPANYVDYRKYIEEFEEKRNVKLNRRRGGRGQKMETEAIDEGAARTVHKDQQLTMETEEENEDQIDEIERMKLLECSGITE